MQCIKKLFDFILSRTIVIIVSILLICVIWQVIARWFNVNSSFTDEAARFLFIWSGLFGASLAHGQKRHLAIDILTSRLIGTSKKLSEILVNSLIILFVGLVMLYGGFMVMANTQGQISAVMGIPMWAIYIAIPINGFLIVFYSLYDLVMIVRNQDIHPTITELS